MKVNLSAVLLLLCLTLLVFWQVSTHDFINYDDDVYVTANASVQRGLSGTGLAWAFTSTDTGIWHPLTWLSHMVDWQLFGSDPKGHHLMNLLLHIFNGILLFFLLDRLTGLPLRSAFVAALFLIHPLHVESVAWVSARKDLLSGLFFMLTLLTYAHYAERPRARAYLFVLLFYMLGLMAKPMLVTLPFVLLILDFWPLGRLGQKQKLHEARQLLLEKVPFLALAAASSIVAVMAQAGVNAMAESLPLTHRVCNALTAYLKYIFLTLWPMDLAVLYPYADNFSIVEGAGAAVILLAITYAAFRLRQCHPYLLTGWLWFLGTLVPVIGLVQVGQQAMANRYTYLPLIGLFIMVAWGMPACLPVCRWKEIALPTAAAMALAAVTAVSLREVSYWRDSISLYQHTLAVTKDNFAIHTNLGAALAARGSFTEAIAHYRQAISINPKVAQIHYNLGVALFRTGNPAGAAASYSEALSIEPRHSGAHNNLGHLLKMEGKRAQAAYHFRQALLIDPSNRIAYLNLQDCLGTEQ